ncbi:Uncharacterised protein [uncultured archaeon]|nr:Uncharacterised protein [uncultured archaeon]
MVANLKGQAMMEYLVTYGWALLALLFVVAFLLASGAFSPNSFSTQECTFQPDLPCPSFVLYLDSAAAGQPATLQFTLRNGLGFPINVTNVTYTATNLGGDGRQTYQGDMPTPARAYLSGDAMGFKHVFTGPRQPSVRDFRSVYVSVSYMNCKSLPCTGPYVTSGRISAPVEEKPA